MKKKNFALALSIALAFEVVSYDIYYFGVLSSLGSGTSVFLSFVLMPLGVLAISWAAISQRKELKATISESTELFELKKKVAKLEETLTSISTVLMNEGYIIENPITESGFRAVHNEYLAPEIKKVKQN